MCNKCKTYFVKEVQECFTKFRCVVAPIRIETGRYEGMEEKDRICFLCDHNIIESKYHVIMSFPVYNELCGELFNHAAQFQHHFNNLNDYDKFVLLFSATDICFYTAKTCFNILTVRRKMLYNTR